ncbi:hypothetical protein Clacol_002645 [Clathrus columnatus]|uniref:Initiator tRNA phosphoribosyl transferase n=1 Tax=Clathrus columnatus TaxID=1419009 RepID=A0AAV5A1D4_9AGAM|nr:hypothetical protein Clacol_002645 [Clathrus columnatus]
MWDHTASSKNARKLIRKESNNTFNRLHSISEDANFVTEVGRSYPDYKVFPNLRCGAWYVDPVVAERQPVYFKSTDGHFGQWAFNLRRSNLHLLQSIVDFGGVIIVDSTRQGKRLPDALSKTIPIWCAVINLATLKLSHNSRLNETSTEWGLYTPPGSAFGALDPAPLGMSPLIFLVVDSEFTLPSLSKPLRPIWITPDTEALPCLSSTDFHPVICLSASRLLSEGSERRVAGYTYVQGSGDDHESWSLGLTPQVYWEHKERLLACPPEELIDLIYSLVNLDRDASPHRMLFPVKAVNSRIVVGTIPSSYPLNMNETNHILITCLSNLESFDSEKILSLKLLPSKKGQIQFLNELLPRALVYLKNCLNTGENVVILCRDGKDLSIGIALTALTLYFDKDGNFIRQGQANEEPTKQIVQRRLQWILADDPYANPSRNTLKRVNEYLMSQPRRLHAVSAAVQ